MKTTLIPLIVALIVISASFGYSQVPNVVRGEFTILLNYGNTSKLDIVILMPKNWSIGDINYVGGDLVQNEVLTKEINNKTYLAIHFQFENVSTLYLNANIIPKSDGNITIYYISPNKFSREIYHIHIESNQYMYFLIPMILMALPPIVYYSREYEHLKRRLKR